MQISRCRKLVHKAETRGYVWSFEQLQGDRIKGRTRERETEREDKGENERKRDREREREKKTGKENKWNLAEDGLCIVLRSPYGG